MCVEKTHHKSVYSLINPWLTRLQQSYFIAVDLVRFNGVVANSAGKSIEVDQKSQKLSSLNPNCGPFEFKFKCDSIYLQ